MKWLRAICDGVSKIESALLVLIVLLMIILSFFQVILRNFFSWGVTWGDVGLRNMVLWVGLIGASLATRQHRHISIDALTRFLSPAGKVAANVLTSLFSFALSLVFVWTSARFVFLEYKAQGMAFLNIPFWAVQIIIPIGFSLIALRFLIKVVEDIVYLKAHIRESK